MISCPKCAESERLDGKPLADGRRQIDCHNCGNQWIRGEAKVVSKPVNTFEEAKKRFPGPENVDPVRMLRVDGLKESFLKVHPKPQPEVAQYWARYQQVFSREGLKVCAPSDLKDFANTDTGAGPGNMSGFNIAWKTMGAEAAASQTRKAIDYLLYGPAEVHLEDRLTNLIHGYKGLGMTGFKEALLTKVLCIMKPERFVPILTYSSDKGGKKEIAKLVYGLELPEEAKVTWTIGRLIFWSNDVLLHLAGDGFASKQHMSQFLWSAKDEQQRLAS
jgi:hypothetical protein